ncbi:MAG TPA: hypothetical protein VJX67_01990 [Blastocatellia bacterium]|nr:hypothetical protein [Blastocatellia bacterium]
MPQSHLELAEVRLNRYRQDPSRAHPAFEVLDRLSENKKIVQARPSQANLGASMYAAASFNSTSASRWNDAFTPVI